MSCNKYWHTILILSTIIILSCNPAARSEAEGLSAGRGLYILHCSHASCHGMPGMDDLDLLEGCFPSFIPLDLGRVGHLPDNLFIRLIGNAGEVHRGINFTSPALGDGSPNRHYLPPQDKAMIREYLHHLHHVLEGGKGDD